VPDVAVAGERLTGAGVDWICEPPGVIGFRDSDGHADSNWVSVVAL